MRIAALDPGAVAQGLTPGMALADARACVPGLAAVEYDPAADRRLIERIADLCDRYTPMVAHDPPDALILDITGSAHLFGGEAGMAADLHARMNRFGLQVKSAFASTPEGASALARFRTAHDAGEHAALRLLPVASLRLEAGAETALCRAGLKTIGDLAERPSAPFAARFGEEAASALDRLLGRVDSRIVPVRLPPDLYFERRFAEPVGHEDVVLQVIAELAGEAAEVLEQRMAGGRRFTVRLYRSDGATRDLGVETSLPIRDPAVLKRLFGERVSSLADPIDPGFGFDMIRLAVPVLEPLAPTQLQLEGGTATEDTLAALVDRLGTRLGHERIRRYAPRSTHIPERSVLTRAALNAVPQPDWPCSTPGEPPMRPLHMFDPPHLIEVLAEVPDGPPLRFRWRRILHEVLRSEGPERISPEWWRVGERGLSRDYYRVEDTRGRRFWIFRRGLYGSETNTPSWFVHGLFA